MSTWGSGHPNECPNYAQTIPIHEVPYEFYTFKTPGALTCKLTPTRDFPLHQMGHATLPLHAETLNLVTLPLCSPLPLPHAPLLVTDIPLLIPFFPLQPKPPAKIKKNKKYGIKLPQLTLRQPLSTHLYRPTLPR
jgi:hypothetical protein